MRYSLDQFVRWVGSLCATAFFLLAGGYVAWRLPAQANEALRVRGMVLAEVIAVQVVEPLLVKDKYGTFQVLESIRQASPDTVYAFVVDAKGEVLADTFRNGFPSELATDAAPLSNPQWTRYRTSLGPVLDIRIPLLDGELGALHLGLSRKKEMLQRNRLLLLLFSGFAIILVITMWSASWVAKRVSHPLRVLSDLAVRVPRQRIKRSQLPRATTTEVETLTGSFGDMIEQLESVEQERDRQRRELASEHSKLRGILQAMREGVVFVDREERIGFSNEAARRLLPDTPEEPGARVEAMLVPDRHRFLSGVLRGTAPDGEKLIRGPTMVYGSDLEVAIVPVFASAGEFVGILEISEDISERLATQQRMISAERLAALGEMAAGLAHEVNNPLDGVQECFRYIAAEGGLPPRARKYIPMIEEGLVRIQRVMGQMLSFARSQPTPECEELKVGDIVVPAALMAHGGLLRRNVALAIEPIGECACLGNREVISQALLNLVLNAADAMPEGGGRIRISASCDDGHVYLLVEDSGPGVSEESRDRVFEPFYSTKQEGEGTGLGLSVSRNLVRSIGGDLLLEDQESDLGGARFKIVLKQCGCENQNGGQ